MKTKTSMCSMKSNSNWKSMSRKGMWGRKKGRTWKENGRKDMMRGRSEEQVEGAMTPEINEECI